MRARVNREKLLRGMETVKPGLDKAGGVTQSSRLCFTKGKLITFNGEIACRVRSGLPAEVVFAVQPHKLMSLVALMNDDNIELEVIDGRLYVYGMGMTTDMTVETEVLLPVESVDVPDDWRPLGVDFADAVSQVQHCVGNDENNRFKYTCIHLTPKWVEATDGKNQAARFTLDTGLTGNALVNQKAILQVIPLGMTEVCLTEAWVHFKNPKSTIFSVRRYPDDKYADIGRALVINDGVSLKVPKGLAEAAKRGGLWTSEQEEAKNLLLARLTSGSIVIEGRGLTGKHVEDKKVKYKGEAMTFTMSPVILEGIARNHNECTISKEKIAASRGRLSYVASLGEPTENGKHKSNGEKKKKKRREDES